MEYSLNELVWFFLFYSLAGWCAGVAVAALRKHTFVNTGFLNLPLCPIYGVAAVLFTVFLSELRDHLFFLFLGCAVSATVFNSCSALSKLMWASASPFLSK